MIRGLREWWADDAWWLEHGARWGLRLAVLAVLISLVGLGLGIGAMR